MSLSPKVAHIFCHSYGRRFSATFFAKVSIGRICRANGPHSLQPFHSRQQMTMTLPQAIGLRGESKMADFDKHAAQREAESLRTLAFFGVCLSTVATVIAVMSVPFAYQHFQQIGSQMQNDVDFCKLRSGNMWREVTRTQAFSKVLHEGRHKRQASSPAVTDSREELDNPEHQPLRHPARTPTVADACPNVRLLNLDSPARRDLLVKTDSPVNPESRHRQADVAHPDNLEPPDPTDSPVAPESLENQERPDSLPKARRWSDRPAHKDRLASPGRPESLDNPDSLETPEDKDLLATAVHPAGPAIQEAMESPDIPEGREPADSATTAHHPVLRQATDYDLEIG
uniref:Col_cuticle_N domain-containing protein n=1 Tax=Globodera pallida TaxID=36090 RepID=A0A183BLF7_GLOPA